MTPDIVPDCTFYTRVRNDKLEGPNPFEWNLRSTNDVFAGKNIVLFAVPGAFTPACSESHLPGYESHYDDFKALGIDEVICLGVNDAFVMFQWAKSRNAEKVFMLPDGNGDFTRRMGMLVQNTKSGMGLRSWRYSMHVKDKRILKLFPETGIGDNVSGGPLAVSDAETMLTYLKGRSG